MHCKKYVGFCAPIIHCCFLPHLAQRFLEEELHTISIGFSLIKSPVARSHNMSKKLVETKTASIVSDKPGECTKTMMAPTGTVSQTLVFKFVIGLSWLIQAYHPKSEWSFSEYMPSAAASFHPNGTRESNFHGGSGAECILASETG